MTSQQRVVLLAGEGLEHAYVALTLSRRPGLAAVVVDRGPRRPAMRRLRRALRRYGVTGVTARGLTRAALSLTGESRRRRAGLEQVLGNEAAMPAVPTYTVSGVNSHETQALLTRLAPDILCVYGTSVIGDTTLALAPLAINMHTGLSPHYRGADCAFWPLHEGEPERLGATVHVCSSALDGGPVFGTRAAVVEAGDGVGQVFGRCVAAGADLFSDVLEAVLDGSASPNPQDLTTGREYRSADRDWRAELRVHLALRRGLLREVPGRRARVQRPAN